MTASSLAVEPAYRSVPDYYQTFGPEVAEVNELAGYRPDAGQRMMLDATFAVDRRGKSVAFEVAAVACRQNIKTGLFKQATLGWLFVTDERLIVWSAHEFGTAQEAFRDLDELIGGSDVLRPRVLHVYRGNGDESFKLRSGARLIFKTRTRGGGRGLSGRKVILDEGMFLQPAHMGALLPTLSAQPDPQVLYGSSAGLAESAVLRGVRDRGRRGGDPRLAYFEWCAPPPEEACADGAGCSHAVNAVGCGCDRPELWQRANPTLGDRISVEYIAAERRALPPAEFGRERMGWWDDPVGNGSPLTVAEWLSRADPDSQVTDPVALGLDVAPFQASAAVGVGGRRGDGLGHGELVEHGAGTGWVVSRLVDLATRWGPCVLALDPAGQAGALIKDLNEAGFVADPGPDGWRLMLLSGRDVAQACGGLVKDIKNDSWRHRGQAPLDSAVEGAQIRPLADAYAWSRKDSSVDISPLVAVTVARYGYATYGLAEPVAPFAVWGS